MSSPNSLLRRVLSLESRDNVSTALEALATGDRFAVQGRELAAREAVPMGHKVAVAGIAAGQPVMKFGEPIGLARCDIEPGDHVHVHNVESLFTDWLAARAGATQS
ncbi:MAG: UxaA family hydrolase [Betaproteobacteria bacterium]|nr:UxaA family hydrolase [Betaproteobacteria bacterium]